MSMPTLTKGTDMSGIGFTPPPPRTLLLVQLALLARLTISLELSLFARPIEMLQDPVKGLSCGQVPHQWRIMGEGKNLRLQRGKDHQLGASLHPPTLDTMD